ncbi:hypothetical protein HXW73_17700 [Halomonas sp. SH5A2]|uniref:hypothetical protein n=1 Tax=Halomonas sp. SH5A2 TaxID=2749040 RepID=UPI001640DD68|nr:hypothetical protein [Halomonas sp. SH5A2]QNI04634.1 hypothetical protein HXW73_17700 [Halomonas sp. SH5A2]
MKTQMTAIAAAIALAMSASALAQTPTEPASPEFDNSRSTINSMAGSSYDGSGLGNDSFIDQNGDDNETSVIQWGTQISRIQQDGNDNTAGVIQDDVVGGSSTGENYSLIMQEKDGNQAYVNQLGQENDSIIDQGRSGSNNAYNYADVDQDGYRNDSWVEQDGYDNLSMVTQFGSLNDSYVKSLGNYNETHTMQHGNELDSDIISAGDDNYTDVLQIGYGHDSFVRTIGDYNSSVVVQSGDYGNASQQNFSQIRTVGSSNTNYVQQGN